MMNPKNKLINDCDPPFYKPSFVKLDALYIVEKNKKLKTTHMSNGDKLSQSELDIIKDSLKKYSDNNEFGFSEKRIDKKLFMNIINQP